ncbi:response regulator, partial [bacterium]
MDVRILHLEDSDLDADLIGQRLRRDGFSGEVVRVSCREDYLHRIEDGEKYDLIISDYQIPSFGGEEALDLAQQSRPDVPFVFVSGALGEDIAVEMLKRGATDYVLKGRLQRLLSAVERALREAKEKTERKMAEDEVRRLKDQLEAKVADRTAELLSANEQLQGFTYSVAHDLRQQIRGISTNASILLEDVPHVLDEASRHTLERLVSSSKQLSILVDELLRYARLGRQEACRERVDLSKMADEISEGLLNDGYH